MPDFPDYVHAVYTSVKNTWQDAENLDDTHGYISYIWIPEETFKVDVMKLWIFAEKFRAYSKSALGGGGQTKTSTSGGGQTKTSTYTTPSHTHQVDIGVKTSAASGLTVTVLASTEVEKANVITDITALQCPDGHDSCKMGEISRSGFVKNVQGTQDYASHPSHTHEVDYGTKTSASGGASHAHNVTIDNHTHDVTIDDHTHPIDFGIYEEAITDRTLSAVLYDPDGNVLKDFGVILTGEDSDVLDLSEYFGTLKYGMYRVVLSASGRLRARLVFYELCKMYAQY